MVPRELILLAAVLSLAGSSPIDLDLESSSAVEAAGGGDYELLLHQQNSAAGALLAAGDDNNLDDLTEERNQVLPPAPPPPRHHQQQREQVRCFCNQPHCVSQGYMCRGRSCFTDLPLLSGNSPHHHQQLINGGRPEHAVFSGCLDQKTERSCPPGKLCCDQDLCNHVDSPAMKLRLNKTLQVMLGGGEHRPGYFTGGSSSSGSPTGQAVPTGSWLDKWLRMATIAVPICGFVMILMLATLAARLLKPLPSPNDKLNGFRMPPETTPPLLGPSGHLHNKLLPLV